MVKAIKADVSTKDVKDSVHPTPGAQCRVVSLEELPIWPNDGADMLLFKRTSRDRKETSLEPVPSLHETDLVRYSHRKQSRLMSQQKTYSTQCRVSSQERSIWPNDGDDILLFKRLSGDRCEVPYEPALSLHEADLVRYLIRFLQLKAYCSFIKSCGGSDTFRGLHLTFQLFFESLEDEGWNIEKESPCPCDLWGWSVATTVKMDEGFCDCGGCRVSSQNPLIWTNDGADILLFKRLSRDRGEVPHEPALSLHEADLVRYLLRFLRLNAYFSFIKSCGGSDTFKRPCA